MKMSGANCIDRASWLIYCERYSSPSVIPSSILSLDIERKDALTMSHNLFHRETAPVMHANYSFTVPLNLRLQLQVPHSNMVH